MRRRTPPPLPPPRKGEGGIDAETTIRTLSTKATRRLTEAGIAGPGFEARRLLEHFAGLTSLELLTRPEQVLPPEDALRLEEALQRRAGGEPLHRILGWREFYGMRLALSPDTLEPRPDTETLVDAVLPFLRERASREKPCSILDLGTGTGAIALALLSQTEDTQAVGVDVAPGALQTAAANAEHLGLAHRFQPLCSDWFEAVSGRFAVIVSNPPYISRDELSRLAPDVSNFDPMRALDGGADGLAAYRILAARSAAYLEEGGRIAVEIGYSQKQAVTELFAEMRISLLAAHRDLGGNDRVLVFALRENAANP